MSDSYNDQATSDITLCFGDNEKIYAHKIILKAASGVWNQAFKSKLPISTQANYDIQGHSDLVVSTMLRHVYGMPLDVKTLELSEDDQVDYLFDVFAIANEYQIPSLGEAVTEHVIWLMKTYSLEPRWNYTRKVVDYTANAGNIKKFGVAVSRIAELYINNDIADKSLMNGVLDHCFTRCDDMKWMEEHLHISSLIGAHDPFAGRLLQLYLPKLHYSK
jgi:hypothetical protein